VEWNGGEANFKPREEAIEKAACSKLTFRDGLATSEDQLGKPFRFIFAMRSEPVFAARGLFVCVENEHRNYRGTGLRTQEEKGGAECPDDLTDE
jgi:hypothetical protein